MLDNSSSKATIDQSIRLPDYFSCQNCAAFSYHGGRCEAFQQAGRCRAEMLGEALRLGAVQVVLYLPVGK